MLDKKDSRQLALAIVAQNAIYIDYHFSMTKMVMYKKIKKVDQFCPPQGVLREVSLHDVRLHEDSQVRVLISNMRLML